MFVPASSKIVITVFDRATGNNLDYNLLETVNDMQTSGKDLRVSSVTTTVKTFWVKRKIE